VEAFLRTSVPLLRHIIRVVGVALLAAALLAACGGSSGDSTSAPSAMPSAAASLSSSSPVAALDVPGSLLVVRKDESRRWAVWRVTPGDASQSRFCALPTEPYSVAVSPGGARAAYLSLSFGPAFTTVDLPSGAVHRVSLARLGVKGVDRATWISDSELVVSGSRDDAYGWPETDRLYVVSADTGRARAFRGLRGTEPSAAPNVGTLVYASLRTLSPGTAAYGNAALVREDLRTLRIRGTHAPGQMATDTYRVYAAYRAFANPFVSPDGRHVLSAITGSDVSAIYELRGKDGFYFSFNAPATPLAAWSRDSDQVAFYGMDVLHDWGGGSRVWVLDLPGSTLTSMPLDPKLGSGFVDSLSWSAGGDLVIGVTGSGDKPGRVLVARGGDLAAPVTVTAGSLPVWAD
jgi:hypothetical protein